MVQCNAMQWNDTITIIQYYNTILQYYWIYCNYMQTCRRLEPSYRVVYLKQFLFNPFSLQKRRTEASLPRYVRHAKSSTVFSFLDKNSQVYFRVLQEQLLNSNSIEKNEGSFSLPKPENDVPNKVCADVIFLRKQFVSKSVFRLSRARKTICPLIYFKYMLILFSKLFSKIEKRKTEIDDWFSFFWWSENEWPFDTRIQQPEDLYLGQKNLTDLLRNVPCKWEKLVMRFNVEFENIALIWNQLLVSRFNSWSNIFRYVFWDIFWHFYRTHFSLNFELFTDTFQFDLFTGHI